MLARLSNNVMTSTLPFYLTTVLHMGGVSSPSEANKKTPWQISLIPLIMYITSVVVSLRMYWISKFLSRRAQYGIGALFTAFGCIPMLVLTHDYQYVTVGIAVLLGVGFSLMLSNAVGFIADFLKMYGTSGGFVWGFISFFDKASSGIALFVITVSFK